MGKCRGKLFAVIATKDPVNLMQTNKNNAHTQKTCSARQDSEALQLIYALEGLLTVSVSKINVKVPSVLEVVMAVSAWQCGAHLQSKFVLERQ